MTETGSESSVWRFLRVALKLRPGELAPTLTMFGMFFSIVGAFVIGRAVRDTLFLAALPASHLAPLYVGQSLALGVMSYAYAVVAQRVPRDRLIVFTPAVLAISVVIARALLGAGDWILYVLYLWIEVIGTVAILEFWTFTNELYHARDGKRLFGLIAAGSTVANIFVGLAVSALAPRIGAKNLLFVCAGLLGFAALLGTSAAARRRRARSVDDAKAKAARDDSSSSSSSRSSIRQDMKKDRALLRTPHVIAIILVLMATYLTVTIVDFQFKAVAAQAFSGNRDGLAQYFGYFYGVGGVIALVVQLAITGRLLERFGVVGTLTVLPFLMAGGSLALMLSPVLWAATLCKGFEHVFRYTINDAGMQLLYMPLSADMRGRAKAFVEGLVKPGAQVIAGGAVMIYGTKTNAVAPLSIGAIALTILWIGSLVRLRGTYVGALRETLQKRRARLVAHNERELESYAPIVERELREAKDPNAPAEDIEHALELANSLHTNLSHVVTPLLEHPRANVRRLACEYVITRASRPAGSALSTVLSGRTRARLIGHVAQRLDDSDLKVRATAIGGYCMLLGESALTRVTPLFEGLRDSKDAAERELAAHALSGLGSTFASLLRPLLDDPEPRVRDAAVLAAADMKAPELIAPLVKALGDSAVARDAAVALARYGANSGIEAALAEVLEDPATKQSAGEHVPRILGELGTPQALNLLMAMLESNDETFRRAACDAFARRARKTGEAVESSSKEAPAAGAPSDRERLTNACLRELGIAYNAIAAAEAIEPTVRLTNLNATALPNVGDTGAAAAMLVSALMEKRESAHDRAFRLLQVLFPAAEAEALREGTKDSDPTRRANALEILDSMLDGPIRPQIVPLLDDSPRSEKLRAGMRFHDLQPEWTSEAWITKLLDDENAWVAACAAHYAGAAQLTGVATKLRDLIRHASTNAKADPTATPDAAAVAEPIVRESALAALEHLLDPTELLQTARFALDDSFAPTRLRAEQIVAKTTATTTTTTTTDEKKTEATP